MMHTSIVRHLTLLFGGMSCAGFLGLGLYLSSAIESHFEALDREILESAIGHVRYVLDTGTDRDLLHDLHARMDRMMIGHGRVSIFVTSDAGVPLAADSAISFPKKETAAAFQRTTVTHPALFTWEKDDHSYRGLAALVSRNGAAHQRLRVAAALNIDQHARFMALFSGAMWVAVAGAIAVSILLGFVVVRRGMNPVRVLARQMRAVSSHRLEQRVAVESLPVELTELGEAFNSMLAKLDDSFRRLSEFSADIAHELRTPLSNLLTQTQVMLSKDRSVEAYRNVLASNAEELERLSRMVSDMLFLAKTDNGAAITVREPIDLGREVHDLFEFYEALAGEVSVGLSLSGELTVIGDRSMLRRALNNLISNAIRYTPPSGTVSVRLSASDGAGIVRVINPGDPIADSVRTRLFERFYRADASRLRDSDGAGLGLAIVKAIAYAHGGGVGVDSSSEGNIFSFWIPVGRELIERV